MKAIELQHRFNSAYAHALQHRPNRAVYHELVNMLMALNMQRLAEGLDPLTMPNLIHTYETLCGPIPKIGSTVQYEDPCNPGTYVKALVLDVFKTGDIRTDRDGVRTRSEYTTIK